MVVFGTSGQDRITHGLINIILFDEFLLHSTAFVWEI